MTPEQRARLAQYRDIITGMAATCGVKITRSQATLGAMLLDLAIAQATLVTTFDAEPVVASEEDYHSVDI